MNILFCIPHLMRYVFNYFGKITVGGGKITIGEQDTRSIIMLLGIIILIIIYFKLPSLLNIINTQGGTQLVNNPVYTDTEYNLGNYEELNGSDNYNYQYAISFWVFIDAAPPNMNSNYTKYTSLLNFGNKPNVLYNPKNNSLMVTMYQKDLNDVTKNKLIDFDNNGNRIIYINNNIRIKNKSNI